MPELGFAMTGVMYQCPGTRMNVPLPFTLEPAATDAAQEYESITCPACRRLHFISKATGKLLGDNSSGVARDRRGRERL